jgi:hypothetical protein
VGAIVPNTGDPVNGMHIDGLTGDDDFYKYPFLAFAPRFGFAWDVFGNGKMAIRGGFGVFYTRANANQIDSQMKLAPSYYKPTIYYGYLSEFSSTAGAITPIDPSSTAWMGDGEQKLDTNYQVNFTIQRDIGFKTVVDFGYVGNFERHAADTHDINPVPEHVYANPAYIFNGAEINANLLRTTYPGFGAIGYQTGSRSDLNYHALQMSVQRRLSHGLQFGAAYTFSKALGTQGWDPYHKAREWYYGPLSQDRTHNLSINYSYNLPGLKSGFARHLVNNWVISGITAYQSGAPVTPTCNVQGGTYADSDPSLSGLGVYATNGTGSFRNAGPGAYYGTGFGARCRQVADPHNYTQNFYTHFNTSAFVMPTLGTYGNIALGTMHQPSWINFDMALGKKIPLGNETRVLRMRVEAYNIFNHPEYSTIDCSVTFRNGVMNNPTLGQYTDTRPARIIALTARIEF